jgi:hypothetical protein
MDRGDVYGESHVIPYPLKRMLPVINGDGEHYWFTVGSTAPGERHEICPAVNICSNQKQCGWISYCLIIK